MEVNEDQIQWPEMEEEPAGFHVGQANVECYFDDDENYYACSIDAIDNGNFTITYTEFGDTVTVTIDYLRASEAEAAAGGEALYAVGQEGLQGQYEDGEWYAIQ